MWAIAAHGIEQSKENDWGLFIRLETERGQFFPAKSKILYIINEEKLFRALMCKVNMNKSFK
jgi:hypothetical protein